MYAAMKSTSRNAPVTANVDVSIRRNECCAPENCLVISRLRLPPTTTSLLRVIVFCASGPMVGAGTVSVPTESVSAIPGTLLVEKDTEHTVGAVPKPGIDFVHRLGKPLLELFRLSAKNRRHPDPAANEESKKHRKNYRDADPARDAAFLEPVRSLGDRESEQHAEEEEEDYGVRDPQQADGDVEPEY